MKKGYFCITISKTWENRRNSPHRRTLVVVLVAALLDGDALRQVLLERELHLRVVHVVHQFVLAHLFGLLHKLPDLERELAGLLAVRNLLAVPLDPLLVVEHLGTCAGWFGRNVSRSMNETKRERERERTDEKMRHEAGKLAVISVLNAVLFKRARIGFFLLLPLLMRFALSIQMNMDIRGAYFRVCDLWSLYRPVLWVTINRLGANNEVFRSAYWNQYIGGVSKKNWMNENEHERVRKTIGNK